MTRFLTLALVFLACAPGRAPELTLDTDAGELDASTDAGDGGSDLDAGGSDSGSDLDAGGADAGPIACASIFDCPPAWDCFQGLCVNDGDAGDVDAGPELDAGEVDAGPELDAGNVDAGCVGCPWLMTPTEVLGPVCSTGVCQCCAVLSGIVSGQDYCASSAMVACP